ncbi:dioxygenase family protein [Falsiroseomonas selenitidurans]|uniref:dioxygenase family protein n=1 Tax=Falsiroseomonas selenitidurans TaxID=2716335 RepID=UPI001ADE119E|nr:protocatechuate 3,4-dioxygenase [Falsiroseomonas selenitidurans]
MPPSAATRPRRRLLLASASAALATPWLGGIAGAQPAAALVPTPRQTPGPYYPVDWTGDADGDLVRVTGTDAAAQGVVTHLRGRVLDAQGAPVAGAVVEIWQCDAFGRYRHPRDRQDGRDPGFQGRGRVQAAADGSYAFRTIRPVAYPGRTPHIHAAVAASGRAPLVTQFYVEGEPLNARDGLFNAVRDARQREALMLRLDRADAIETGALLAVRDIVLA